jgi:hypothetical protein
LVKRAIVVSQHLLSYDVVSLLDLEMPTAEEVDLAHAEAVSRQFLAQGWGPDDVRQRLEEIPLA